MPKKPQKHTPHQADTSTSWGSVAPWYDELLSGDDTYQEKVILPNLLRLVDPKPGMSILDVACGQGYFSMALLERGAVVVGVDVSPELIARAKAAAPSGNFIVSPANDLSKISVSSIDQSIMVLAAQNIQDFNGAVREVARVLRDSGIFTLILNHPAFRIPKQSSWEYDKMNDIQYRRLDAYLSEARVAIDMHPGKKGGGTTISFHRPLQWYFKVLAKHGFLVDRLEEWISHKKSVGTRAKAENLARKEFPLFLGLRSIKLSTKVGPL